MVDRNGSFDGLLPAGVAGGLIRFSFEGIGSIGHGVDVSSLAGGGVLDLMRCTDSGDVESTEYVYRRFGDLKRTLRDDDDSLRFLEDTDCPTRIDDCRLHTGTIGGVEGGSVVAAFIAFPSPALLLCNMLSASRDRKISLLLLTTSNSSASVSSVRPRTPSPFLVIPGGM